MNQFFIRRTVIIGYTISLAVISFFTWYTYQSMRQVEVESQHITEALAALKIVEKVMDDVQDIESTHQRYIISNSPSDLTGYQAIRHHFIQDSLAMMQLQKKDEKRVADVNVLMGMINRRLEMLENSVVLNTLHPELTPEQLHPDASRLTMDSIRERGLAIENEDRIFLRESNINRETAARNTARLFVMTAAIFFALLVVLYILVRRMIRRQFGRELITQVNEKTFQVTDIIERISDGFLALDSNWDYVYINDKAAEFAGQRKERLVGRNIWSIQPDLAGSAFQTACYSAFTAQQSLSFELQNEKSGQFFEITIYPSGQGISMYFRDVTEKKKNEQQLRTVNDRFNTVAKATNDIIWEADLVKDQLWWNDNFYEQLGYPRDTETLSAQSWELHLHPDDKDRVLKHIEHTLFETKDDTWVDEYRFVKADGHFFHIYDRCYIFRDETGKPYKMIGSMANLTQLLEAREELKKAQGISDKIIDSLPGIFYFFDEQGKFLRWNKQLENITGYSAADISSMRPADFFPFAEREYVEKRTALAFTEGESDAEAHLYTKDGRQILYYFKGARIILGEMPFIIGTGIDISESKKAELELEQSYESIRQLTEHLQNIREEERTHIAREIHDELGQLITVMKMDVAWMNKRMQPENEVFKQKMEGLLELLDSTVKTVRRISSELRPSLLDDLGVVAAMEWHAREFESRSGIRIDFSASVDEASIAKEIKTGTFRIFQESLTNTARHAAASNIWVTLSEENGNLLLSITDDGKGFDQKKAAGRRTLGILGMKERSLMLGGEYNIISEEGKGTKVFVSIPLRPKQAVTE